MSVWAIESVLFIPWDSECLALLQNPSLWTCFPVALEGTRCQDNFLAVSHRPGHAGWATSS